MTMLSQATLDALKGIGLNMYERKMYAALLARGTSTVSELSEMSGVPRSRGYDVLESLADKGFVIIQHAKPIKFVAVKPDEALEKQKKLLRDNFDRGVTRIDSFKGSDSLDELKKLYDGGISLVDPSDMNGSLKGKYALHLQLDTMFKAAEKTIDILTTEDGLSEMHQNHLSVLKKAAKKGLKIRIVSPVTDKNKNSADEIGKLAEIKDVNGKNVPSSNMFLTDMEAVLTLTGDGAHPTQQIHFWTKSDHFTRNFAQNTFEMAWKA